MQAVCHISLESIAHNYRFFEQRVASAQIIPVVKANAYGHGAVEVTRYLYQNCDSKFFAVATLEEALELSALFPDISILIFSRVFPDELSNLPDNVVLTVGSVEDWESLEASGRSEQKVHLNVNTGMNRLGLSPDQGLELFRQTRALDIQGIYSHFSSSDTLSDSQFQKQKTRFKHLVHQFKDLGFTGMIHLANSAGALHDDIEFYDAIRLGIGLYGYDTTPDATWKDELRPAMEIQAPLIRIDRIATGAPVSYAEKWRAATDTNIGTLRIGYADGYNRGLTNRGAAIFQGKQYPIIGTVTMDHIMIDLGNDAPETGSYFTVMGGEQSNTIEQIAQQLNTITYEVCCAISNRVKRIY